MNEEEIYQARLALIRAKKAQSRNLGLFCATGGAIAFTYAGFSGAAAAFLIYLGAKNMIEKPIATAVHGDDGAMSAAAKKHLPNDERRIIEGQPIRAPHTQTSTTLEKPHHEPPRSIGGDPQSSRQLPIRNAPRLTTVARSGTGEGEGVGSEERDRVPPVGGGDPVEIITTQPDTEPRTERVAGLQYRPGGFAPAADPIAAKYGATIASVTDMHSPASKPRHLALLAITQCGKTTTMGAMSYALRDRYPDMRFVAIDTKNAPWPDFYESVLFPGYGLSLDPTLIIKQIEAVYRELERRVEGKLKGDRLAPRIFLVLDEWNLTHDAIKGLSRKPDSYGQVPDGCITVEEFQKMDRMVAGIVMQGLEFGVHLCMVLQEPNCDKIGLSDAGRLNIHFLALARAGELSMVDAMLDSSMILKSRQRADQLRGKFDKVWTDPARPPMSPVIVDSRTYTAEALPNFSGQFNLIQFDHGDPHHAPTPTPPPAATEASTAPDRPTGTSSDNAQDVAPADNGDRPLQPRDGVRAGLLADVTDEALRGEFLKGKSYKDVLRGFGIPPGSSEALRVAQVNAAVDGEIRTVARTHSQNATAESFGVSKGSGAAYQHICKVWREENPPPPPVFSGMV